MNRFIVASSILTFLTCSWAALAGMGVGTIKCLN